MFHLMCTDLTDLTAVIASKLPDTNAEISGGHDDGGNCVCNILSKQVLNHDCR